MTPLYKSTIVIWTSWNPSHVEFDTLAEEAMRGDAYCSTQKQVLVEDPAADPDWDGTEFFDVPQDEEDE